MTRAASASALCVGGGYRYTAAAIMSWWWAKGDWVDGAGWNELRVYPTSYENARTSMHAPNSPRTRNDGRRAWRCVRSAIILFQNWIPLRLVHICDVHLCSLDDNDVLSLSTHAPRRAHAIISLCLHSRQQPRIKARAAAAPRACAPPRPQHPRTPAAKAAAPLALPNAPDPGTRGDEHVFDLHALDKERIALFQVAPAELGAAYA